MRKGSGFTIIEQVMVLVSEFQKVVRKLEQQVNLIARHVLIMFKKQLKLHLLSILPLGICCLGMMRLPYTKKQMHKTMPD